MGKKGGNATKERQDKDFYSRIGKLGGEAKRQKLGQKRSGEGKRQKENS
jgi:general stress protein YciG